MVSLNGVILIDKPAGPSSARVVARLKKLLRCDKIGHAGTLDPPATGLLIILCGKAAKLQEFFLGEEKTYCGQIKLGTTTSTDDAAGEVIHDFREAESFAQLMGSSTEELGRISEKLIDQFSGPQMQVPPQVSALKVGGQRAYKSARANRHVNLKAREMIVSELMLRFVSPDLIDYRVRASKGYYVRALARDIGEALGSGAHIETLRRLESAPFSIDQACRLEEIESESIPASRLIPLEKLPLRMSRVEIGEETYRRLCLGDQRPLEQIRVLEQGKAAALIVEGGRFGGVLETHPELGYKVRFLV
jgi:tRNA pseudouridine55 synthase